MLLAHLSDLHLGHRAYDRLDGGRNVREQDVAQAFHRAVQEVIRVGPDLILLAGDIFDRPDPPPGALVALARGLEAFRAAMASVPIFMVAGARDTPPPLLDPGALAALEAFPQVEAATRRARSILLADLQTHLYLVPHGALLRRPYPEMRTHPEARWNLLLAYAGVGTGSGAGLPLDPGPWDYVALGYLHQHQKVGPRVFYSGSLERVGPEPWREAAQEKGFLTFDLERGVSRFHPIPGRPVVALAPIRIPRGEAGRLPGKVREVLGEVPGGIEGKIVRLRVEGLSPDEVSREEDGLFASLREQALHLAVEVDDFHTVGDDNLLPIVGRDRGFALRALRELIEGHEKEESLLPLLVEFTPGPGAPVDAPGLETELLIRELRGTEFPLLGSLSMEAGEGLLGWVGVDGRTLRAFTGILLWGVGLEADPPGVQEGRHVGRGPALALRLGVGAGSFWLRRGVSPGFSFPEDEEAGPKSWGLPREGISLAWCGVGGGAPEQVLEGGEELLAYARGAGDLRTVEDGLVARFPGLGRELALGEISARDYERLRLESELADLESQLRSLVDVPDRVTELESELRNLRSSGVEVAGDAEVATMDWHRERQDSETNLLAYRDRAKELRTRIRRLEALGPESPCPTCGRLLEERFKEVLDELREEWEALVQDGKWWRRRWEQLEEKPQVVRELERLSVELNARYEDCTERLERARSGLREMDELRVREKEVRGRLALLRGPGEGSSEETVDLGAVEGGGKGGPAAPDGARLFLEIVQELRERILLEGRTRLLNLGGRRLNRLTGGRILGLRSDDAGGEVHLVDGGGSAGVEAEEDRAAAVVALRMALVELLAEEWGPLGSFVVGDPFDRMGGEDQLRALSLLRRVLSRIPQVLLLTRGPVVERASEFFDGLFEFREEPAEGSPRLRSLPAGVGMLRLR